MEYERGWNKSINKHRCFNLKESTLEHLYEAVIVVRINVEFKLFCKKDYLMENYFRAKR